MTTGLSTLADDLTSAAALLIRESVVARYLTQPAEDSSPRVQLVERLLSGKVGQPALDVLKAAVAERWSAEADLVDAIELVGPASPADPRREGRQGRRGRRPAVPVLAAFSTPQPRLAILLGDYEVDADARVRCCATSSTARAPAPTRSRLNCSPRRLSCSADSRPKTAVQSLAEVAVARRGEVVAQVRAAAELTDAQHTRLTEVLSRIYGHPVTAQIPLDPELLGGLAISVGDEIIDGTLSSRLAAAQTQLPD